MSRPSRLRWVAKWGGMVACVLTVLAYATTMRWYSVGVNSGKNYAIALGSGAVRVYWVGRWLPGFTPLTAMKPGRWARLADSLGDTRIRDGWLREAWWPESYFQAGLRWVSIPLWMPRTMLRRETLRLMAWCSTSSCVSAQSTESATFTRGSGQCGEGRKFLR